MTRLERRIQEDEGETVLVLGGPQGVVTLHVSLCGVPQCMVLHSPRELPWADGAWADRTYDACRWMEMPCWYLSSVVSEDEELRTLMADVYRVYLDGGR